MDQVIDQEENVLADYSYNAVRRTGLQYLNGTSVSYDYNDANWITALFNTQSDQGDISEFAYTHDEAGNRLTNTASWGTQTYSYDNIYQVTQVDYPDGYPFSDMTYYYDPVGNRDSTIDGGTVNYENNELNEYTSVDWTTFTSDLRGNLTNDGSNIYSYDLENKLTAVNSNINYEYNPFGLRIGKTVDGDTTNYVLYNNRVIEEWEDENLVRKFIYGVGIDEPLVMETGGNRYFYHFDALGSVQNLTDSTGTILATYKYDIYGDFQISGDAHGNPYTFTGRRYDPESALFYYRARMYSVEIGRFLQADPIGYKAGLNIYTYVLNNVNNNIDSSGLYSGFSDWTTEDFVNIYLAGYGLPVDLEEAGLLDEVITSAGACIEQAEVIVLVAATTVGRSLKCPEGGNAEISNTLSCKFDATANIFVLGNTTLLTDYKCNISADCTNCNYSYSCNLHHRIRDSFEDPLDIGVEIPFSVPYDITADWYSNLSGGGKL